MCSFLLEIGSFDCVPYGTSLRMKSLGDEGIRTPDLLLARQALSQLSYAPALRGAISGEFSGKLHPQWA